MKELIGYFPPHLLLALGCGLVVVSLIFLTLLFAAIIGFLKLVGKNVSSTKFYLSTKLIGTLSVITLAFAANNFFVYFFSTIIIATLITDLDFIEKVAAIISKSPDYFRFREKMVDEGREKSQADLRISATEKDVLNRELERNRAGLRILYHFERTYRLIFGTQLMLLDIILKSNEKQIKGELAQAIYNRSPWPGRYPFESYINFLKTSELITHNPNTDVFSITDLGEAFFGYLVLNKISLNKPF